MSLRIIVAYLRITVKASCITIVLLCIFMRLASQRTSAIGLDQKHGVIMTIRNGKQETGLVSMWTQRQPNTKWTAADLQSWLSPEPRLKHTTCMKLFLIKITLPNTGFNTSVPSSSSLYHTQTNYHCVSICSNDGDMTRALHQLNIVNM